MSDAADGHRGPVSTGHRDVDEISRFDQGPHDHQSPDDFSFLSDHARHGGSNHSHHDLMV
jgi:hypothetical protein